MEITNNIQERIYRYSESCVFRKTKENYGGLSNMASNFPLKVNGIYILTSEALYQACRFPHFPDVQKKIIEEKSPMAAKMVGKPYRDNSRPDWDKIRVELMYWCLRVKLAQNFLSFGQLLETTWERPIVEDSSKDKFWGAVKAKDDKTILVGINALGRLLMKLRQEYNSEKRYDLLLVEPLNMPDFFLYNNPIQRIDERQIFLETLARKMKLNQQTSATIENRTFNLYNQKLTVMSSAQQPNTIVEKSDRQEKKQIGKRKTKSSEPPSPEPDLFTNY
jgi:ribA/ribD-fused uncharacterized protein